MIEYIIGHVAEWLGIGLQNLILRFDSAHDLFIFIKPLVSIAELNLQKQPDGVSILLFVKCVKPV
jgi:hypothetical protein